MLYSHVKTYPTIVAVYLLNGWNSRKTRAGCVLFPAPSLHPQPFAEHPAYHRCLVHARWMREVSEAVVLSPGRPAQSPGHV